MGPWGCDPVEAIALPATLVAVEPASAYLESYLWVVFVGFVLPALSPSVFLVNSPLISLGLPLNL